jgi:nucleotide-binding universal stress UspA family protein
MSFEPKRILVGADFSECSAAALRLADKIAEKFSATLVVLHAIPPAEPVSPLARYVLLPERNEALTAVENRFVMFIRGVIGRKPMPDYRIVEGHAAEAVLFAAGYEKAGMIALGTRGQGGSSRLTLGSVSERILRLATVPVLTICPRRATKRRPGTLERILCPVNYSAAAGKAIEASVSLGKAFGAEVIALHVIEEKSFDGDLDAESERLRTWTRGLVPKPARPRPLIVGGNAAAEVLRYAEHNDIDLIVVGARRERFSDTTVFGTTAERVTRNAPCAVLTVTVAAEPSSDPRVRRRR